VIPLIGGIVTPAARAAGHTLALALTGTVMVGVVIFLWMEKKKRFGTHWDVSGPLYLSALGGALMIADPLRHVLQDNDVVVMNQYRPDCPTENFACLSTIGWIFTVAFTYSGIALLVIGTMWNADLIGKCEEIRDKWREIRSEA
jgi:hypothetical protein